jgi:transcriptional regulator with PAS, ATPase and Fis domain
MALNSILVVSRKSQLQKAANGIAKKVLVADDPAEAFALAAGCSCDVALFDNVFTSDEIRHFIRQTDNNQLSIPVVVAGTPDKSSLLAQQFNGTGPVGYISDTNEMDRLEEIINERSNCPVKKESSKKLSQYFIDDLAASASLAGISDALHNVLKMVRLVGSSKCDPILVTGETGTGKELIARAIHSIRNPNESFVAVNCAALTATLLESELFGHVKGSFTGADKEKTGLLELACNGTVFLDEISEMPLELQAKLLRILQEKTFRKVGGTKTVTCNATIIASSNRNLLAEVKEKRFRQDLYYRLNVCPIKLLPLRHKQRKQDIRLLAKYFLDTSMVWPQKSKTIESLTALALEALEKHDWPGNVRELRNVIDRAILLENTNKIGLSSIFIEQAEDIDSFEQTGPNQVNDFSIAAAERQLIARALKETGWQKTKAAALLGITRATLYAKVKQYKIADTPNNPQPAQEQPELEAASVH